MRKILIVIAAVGLLLLDTATAQADHAQDWSANGDSFVVDATTVHLEGGNTSVETAALGINVDAGTAISFDYVLVNGALCEAGAPRVFLIVNGTINKSDACDGTGQAETEGTISFTTGNAGLITGAGVVYDSGRPGHVLVSNLSIGGQVVHFANPEPTVEPTPEPTETPTPTVGPTTEPTAEPTAEPTTPAAVPTAVPAGQELPKTGATTLPLVLGAALVLLGGGLLLARKALRR